MGPYKGPGMHSPCQKEETYEQKTCHAPLHATLPHPSRIRPPALRAAHAAGRRGRRCRHSCGCVNLLSSGDAGQTGGVQCAHERMLVTYADRLAARLYREKNRQFLRMHYDRGYALLSLAEDALRRTRD